LARNKYFNRKTVINGIVYDSKKEGRRHNELLILQKEGLITDLKTQVPFILIPCQREPSIIGKRGGVKKGKVLEREVKYIADFVYFDKDTNEIVVEDTKGFKTKDYIIKRKLMLYIHGIKIREL
jgi:hypothetical protein